MKVKSITFAEIGQCVGITKERVRQIALACGVGSGRERRRACTIKKRLQTATTPELEKVMEEARSRGLRIERVRVRHRFHIRFCTTRLLIEEKRCQIMAAYRIRLLPDYPQPRYVRIRPPRTKWADFIVYVLKDEKRKPRISFFVVPREKAIQTAFAYPSPSKSQMAQYANAWHLLSAV